MYARKLALAATLSAALLSGCHSSAPAPGSVTVQMPNGTTQVIPAGQPIPVGATVVASKTTAASVPAAPGTAPAAAGGPTTAPMTNPAPEAPAPMPALVVPAGTHVTIRTTETLSAEHSGGVGTGFSGVLNAPVTVHGVVAFPRGTTVHGEIASAKGKGHFAGAGDLGIVLTAIGGYRVQSSEYVVHAKGRGKRSAAFIGGGAGVGALIGGLAGGGKGALIGGLAGGGAGTAGAAYTGSRDVVIPSESAITFTTRSAIELHS